MPRMTTTTIGFGYQPPAGDRGIEPIRPATFVADLHHVIDAAAQGMTSVWVPDHLMFGAKYRHECWTQLVWVAARYPTLNVGTIVLANSFRNPALLAKMAATLQTLSEGRHILGFGAGWHAEEYAGYGFDYPSLGTRLDMMEEAIQVIRALWAEGPVTFDGRFYHLKDGYCEPRPSPPPPLMIGGSGEKRTLPITARYADWWNDLSRPHDVLQRKLDLLRGYCQAEGRDFATLRKSLSIQVYIDRSHTQALARAGDKVGSDNPPLAGDPSAIREQIAELAELGIDLLQLIFPRFPDTDDIQLFIDEVLPAF